MRLKRIRIITTPVIIALVVYAITSLFTLKQQTETAEAKRAELQEQVDSALQENSELQYDIDHSTDPEILEDVAKSDIGLVKPGEIIFYDVGD